VEGTADALHRALTMPLEERRRRAEGLRSSVEVDDVTKWFENQVADMLAYKPEPRPERDEAEEEVALPANVVSLTGSDRVSTAGA
jgi:trehalose-6-phosphate synthase